MNTNHRKRKYRGAARHHNSHSFAQKQDEIEPFLSHHTAYLNQHQNSSSSSSSWAGGDHARSGGLDSGRGVTHNDVSFSSDVHRPGPDPLQALYIQVHEADIIRGASARIAARSLEVVEYHVVPLPPVSGTTSESGSTSRASMAKRAAEGAAPVIVTPKIGSALIEWGGGSDLGRRSARAGSSADAAGSGAHSGLVVVDDDNEDGGAMAITAERTAQTSAPIWVDRYDVRLLLDALPETSFHTQALGPSSPAGWSDLSSDAEDTFFLDPHETEDFKREKRRRVLEHTREERLRARMQEDGSDGEKEEEEEEEDVWGGSDEEPGPTQKELMERTATHLLSSPNAAQLEMRILANHGGDQRFAFLRGRWKRAWGIAKAKARMALTKKEEEEKKATATTASGSVLALAGYGSDSDERGGSAGEGQGDDAPSSSVAVTVPTSGPAATSPSALGSVDEKAQPKEDADSNAEEMALKEARRKRLKAWAEKRRAAQSQNQAGEAT